MGYLNINNLLDSLHGQYLNADKNLAHLDLLCLAETHLLPSTSDDSLSLVLTNYEILARFDSNDNRKHLGLLLLRSRLSKLTLQIDQVSKISLMRQGQLQCQVIQMCLSLIHFIDKYLSGPECDTEVKQPRLCF